MAKKSKPSYSKVGILNAKELSRQMDGLKDRAALAEKRLISDFSKRIPAMVASSVTKRYNVDRQQVTGKVHKSAKKPPKKVIGTTRIKGNTVGSVHVQYVGSPLILSHFGLTPKVPPKGRGYTLRASILRGKRFTLGKVKKQTKRDYKRRKRGIRRSQRSPVMLLPARHARKAGAGSAYIPIQRRSTRRNDLHTAKTLSLPQMVDNREVRAELNPNIERFVNERLEHHLSRLGLKEK